MGDGLYNLIKVMLLSFLSYSETRRRHQPGAPGGAANGDSDHVLHTPGGTLRSRDMVSDDPRETKAAQLKALRTAVFLKDDIPWWVSVAGVIVFGVLALIIVPHVFPSVRWYYVLVSYAFIPFFSVANSYGAGLTDWNMASVYGKIALFCFAAWASEGGGIIAGLGMCGVLLATTNAAADLMQDFRTGFITLSSPRSHVRCPAWWAPSLGCSWDRLPSTCLHRLFQWEIPMVRTQHHTLRYIGRWLL
eukprot:jgi/Botrbrau1/15204/Bobra.0149s0063.1